MGEPGKQEKNYGITTQNHLRLACVHRGNKDIEPPWPWLGREEEKANNNHLLSKHQKKRQFPEMKEKVREVWPTRSGETDD